jgi:hypothetical protein
VAERFDRDLDRALGDLAGEIAWPPTPALHQRIGRRIAPPPAPRWAAALPRAWPRALALAVVATLLLVAAAAALALILPGLRITLVPTLPSASVATDALGTRHALGQPVAADSVAFDAPSELGPPDEVYASHGGDVVTLVYAADARLPELFDSGIGLLIQEIRGSLDRERVEKLVVEVGATITEVAIGADPGYWIEGPRHLVRYRGPSGEERTEMTRLVGDSLMWERAGVLYRIESGLGRDETIRIAESIGG